MKVLAVGVSSFLLITNLQFSYNYFYPCSEKLVCFYRFAYAEEVLARLVCVISLCSYSLAITETPAVATERERRQVYSCICFTHLSAMMNRSV